MTGKRAGHFDILEPLGEGGMGVVYKARDIELGRLVAIKVLAGTHAADSERRLRFIQEARAASALNHPNIVTIHEIFRENETDFIAMELVPGKTLDQVIRGKAMKLPEALQIAAQTAAALTAAHAAGITHRDLKPGNIMVTAEGRVKILDFGLAKLTERTPIGQEESTLIIQTPITESGTILGTIAYMSPEQAEAKELDSRSDIFSFGAVLYEMLTGRKAFAGESKVATLSSILTAEPKPLENMPAELERIVRRCLRKDRQKRFQHMDDVKVSLEEIREDSESGRLAVPARLPVAGRSKAGWAVPAALVLVIAAAVGIWMVERQPEPATSLQGPSLQQITFDSGLTQEPTLWPAGNMIAYSSDRAGNNLDIWVQHLGTQEARRLTTHEAEDREPAFSPDGSRIAFRSERSGGGIYVVSTLGGAERRIADAGRGPRFSPDGKWIAYYTGWHVGENAPASFSAALHIVEATGGTPKRIASKLTAVSQPVWSPDSRSVLFVGGPHLNDIDWWIVSIADGKEIRSGAMASFQERKLRARDPRGWDGDFVYFLADVADSRNIWRVRIEPKTFHLSGVPERITFGQGQDANPWIDRGRMLFTNLTENSDIWSLAADTNAGKVLGEPKRITAGLASETNCHVSRDGRFVVFSTIRGGTTEVIWKDLGSGEERVLVTNSAYGFTANISPDGFQVAVTTRGAEIQTGYVISAKGGAPRTVCEDCILRNWAADSKRLVITKPKGQVSGLLDPETGKSNLFLPYGPYPNHSAPRMLPDDQWIIWYAVINNDHSRMFIAPVKEGIVSEKEWIPITDGSAWDVLPSFSPDGKTLYFLSQRDGFRCFWALKIDPVTKKPIGQPYPVYHLHSARLSPAYVRVGRIESDTARDKFVFTMAERTGNIWMADLK